MFETDHLPQLLILLALLVQHCPSTKAQELTPENKNGERATLAAPQQASVFALLY